MTTPTVNISTTSNENSGKEKSRISVAAILVQAFGSLGPLAYIPLVCLFEFLTDRSVSGSGILMPFLAPFILSWSLVNAINFLIELKLKLFNFKAFLKKAVWIVSIWFVPWTVYFFISDLGSPHDIHSFEYEMYSFGQAFEYCLFILLTASLWPLVATFFKKPSFKREVVVFIISVQIAILLSFALYIFY